MNNVKPPLSPEILEAINVAIEVAMRLRAEADELLDSHECSAWLGISQKALRKAVKSRKIPCLRLNDRVWRFSKATILGRIADSIPKNPIATRKF